MRISSADRLAWSPREVADRLGVSLSFVRKEIHKGNLTGRKLGRRTVILVGDLDDYLAHGDRRESLSA